MRYNIFSLKLQEKIDCLKQKREAVKLGSLDFDSSLLLAPMSSITTPPFRLLMEKLGAGGSVSELVSCHGINYGNAKTLQMLTIDPREQNAGIQLFGENPKDLASAAQKTESYRPKFIDINMGCPVRKVVTKGSGSALLRDTSKLGRFFHTIKKAVSVPLTIKIRTGWDESHKNATEVISIAFNEGIEFVAVHGRTRAQQYKGEADWSYLENLKVDALLPLVGNGDLHTTDIVKEKLKSTSLNALMLGRGPLRNPFMFLEAFADEDEPSFRPTDFFEVTDALGRLFQDYYGPLGINSLILLKRHTAWFAHGFTGASKARQIFFQAENFEKLLDSAKEYFVGLESVGITTKNIETTRPFMAGGHG